MGKIATAWQRFALLTLLLLRLPLLPLKIQALLTLYLCAHQRFVRVGVSSRTAINDSRTPFYLIHNLTVASCHC